MPTPNPTDHEYQVPTAGGHNPSAGTHGVRSPRRRAPLTARGEPMVWLTGGCVGTAVLMILLLLGFIGWQGITTFWPGPLLQLKTKDGKVVLGEPARRETYTLAEGAGTTAAPATRSLIKTGNYDSTGDDFTWVDDRNVIDTSYPAWGLVIERVAWQNGYGTLEGIVVDGETISDPAVAWRKFHEVHSSIRATVDKIHRIEKHSIGEISRQQDELRLALHGVEMKHGKDSAEYAEKAASQRPRLAELDAEYQELRKEAGDLWDQAKKARLLVRTSQGKIIPADRSKPDEPMFVWQVVRAYPANQLGLWGKIEVYFSRWWEFLSCEPREANMEGGVFPAIVGTVLLTFIMVLVVVPLGVIAAVYLREYARQGWIVSIVRIAVNNLAGVPSIVFGVFGLGFFCYAVGGSIDRTFFAERLPDPTVGKSALVWASLTLALLTLPVVIVATEEALAAVPGSMREGAYACGASKWQVIRRIVLPRAMPGIMTGMILAIARGAGEVAPLMLVGAVKLAPALPISSHPPFFGSDRSFMHLGFHIYDLGFQSRNSEAARSMVYTTALLLIGIVVLLNISAMILRARVRKSYASGKF
jgi:phosphate transport system permease protein